MKSIGVLESCAADHLKEFADPRSGRSFHTYDRQGSRSVFEPLDALAPLLLDAWIPRSSVNRMWSGDCADPYNQLRVAIERCLAELNRLSGGDPDQPKFIEADLNDQDGPWNLVRACLRASERTYGIKASKVSKMLHRKWPNFVPIIDSRLTAFYELPKNRPWEYWTVLQEDHRENIDWLTEFANGILTLDNRLLSPLRAHDIVIWEHIESKCEQG